MARNKKIDSVDVFVVLADVSDLEAGSLEPDIPVATLAFMGASANSLMRARAKALDAVVEMSARLVALGVEGGYLQAAGGLSVLLRLYKVSLSYTAGTPPAWDLQDDHEHYLVRDKSYVFRYDSGRGSDSGHWDDLDLFDYLPPAEQVLALYAQSRNALGQAWGAYPVTGRRDGTPETQGMRFEQEGPAGGMVGNRAEKVALEDVWVDAVWTGDSKSIKRLGKRLLKAFEDVDGGPTPVAEGTLLRYEQVPNEPDDIYADGESPGLALLDDYVSADRLEQLEAGDPFTPAEAEALRLRASEWVLSSGPLDWDAYSMWSVKPVTASDGRVAFLASLSGGYSFTEVTVQVVSGTATVGEALASLKKLGYISLSDLRERYHAR